MNVSENVKSILQRIAELSPGELAELRLQWGQRNGSQLVPSELQTDPKDLAAFRWINEHADEYPGEWLALDGDQLLAHGTGLAEVAAAARAAGIQFPLLHLVEPPREHPYIRS